MRLEKYSLYSDSVANLYRAAFYLARGSIKTSFEFLERAQEKLGKNKSFELGKIIINKKKDLSESRKRLYWAEKILDLYHKLKCL